MAYSGWSELRRRALVIAAAGAFLVACLVVLDRHTEEPEPGAATLALAPENGGILAADVPLRTIPDGVKGATIDTEPFSMIGLTWKGPERKVRVSTRSDGEWSRWRRLPLLHDGPDAVGPEEGAGLTATGLRWVGTSDGVRVRVAGGTPDDVTLVLLQPDGTPAQRLNKRLDKPVAKAGTKKAGKKKHAKRPRRRPPIRSRKQWGANEAWRNGSETVIRTIQQMHVHHTANSNDYRRKDVPGLLRGIYRYHTKNLGWNDVGYNFLVDRFGRIWVGRANSANRLVMGAHTLGFNSTSFGVAVIGNYMNKRPEPKVLTALVQLAAWRLARYHRNPQGRVKVYSHGSDKYPVGRSVRLPVIDGHRDTNDTSCPGDRLYKRLSAIRVRAARRIARFG